MTDNKDIIEIDSEVVDAVAQKVLAQMPAQATAEEIAEKISAITAEKAEKTVKKNIHESSEVAVAKEAFAELPKEVRFTRGLKAYLNNDSKAMGEYNSYVSKAWIGKADYQNVTTGVDGGSLVPDPEFVAEVERLTEDYGVASRLATVRRTDRDSVTLLSGTNEISFVATDEATAQNATKLTYTQATVALKKYIATLVMTSEIIEDSAVDIFADATSEIARARAKLFDELVFTDATHGLLSANVGNTYKTQTVGTAITDFDFDDAMDASYKVVSSVRRRGVYFMHPTVWNELRQKKSGDGVNASATYYAGGPLEAPTPMIDGYRVELVDVMPAVGDITANEAFAVFGDLSRVMIHVKRLLETKVFDSGVVKDAGGNDINLITQDSWAMRATMRVVPQTRFQGAFCIIGTGTVS